MTLLIETIIAVVIAIVVYLIIHRMVVRRATLIVRRSAQRETDAVVHEVLMQLKQATKIEDFDHSEQPSVTVADVWGRGVMAFEYQMKIELAEEAVPRLEKDLNQKLQQVAHERDIVAIDPSVAPFEVTDIWHFKGILHFDVAYVVNEATLEYLKDLHRLK